MKQTSYLLLRSNRLLRRFPCGICSSRTDTTTSIASGCVPDTIGILNFSKGSDLVGHRRSVRKDFSTLNKSTSSCRFELLQQLRDTPQLFEQIARLHGSELSIQQKLRAEFDGELVAAAMALSEARAKARELLPLGEQLWLTRVALEQSTAWDLAQHKASRFPADANVLDLCSGIGVDSAALLKRGPATSIDLDPAMATACQWNLKLWKRNGVIPADAASQSIISDVHSVDVTGKLIHVDPDRRAGRDRPVKRLEQYCPNLEWMESAIHSAAGGAIKLGPASNFMQKFPGCQIELVSLKGECREATVWFGELAEEQPFRATLLPSGETIAAAPLDAWCEQADEPRSFLFDPDPAIVRAGLTDKLGSLHSMERLDSAEEYLTGDSIPNTGFVRAFEVLGVFPNNLKHLNKFLRTQPSREYEVKCRHLRIDANEVQKKLPRGEGEPKVIFFARVNGRAKIIAAKRA